MNFFLYSWRLEDWRKNESSYVRMDHLTGDWKVVKSNMTARLGEVRKATVHKAQVVEEPRAAHYRNDDRHDQQSWMWTTWELCTLHVNFISTGIIEATAWFNMFDAILHWMIPAKWFRKVWCISASNDTDGMVPTTWFRNGFMYDGRIDSFLGKQLVLRQG